MTEEANWTNENLLEVARTQKVILWMLLLTLAATPIRYATIASGAIQTLPVYRAARAIRSTAGWLYIVLGFFPGAGILALLYIIHRTTRVLISNGVKVGWLGAKESEIERLEQQTPKE